MKTLRIIPFIAIMIALSQYGFAQNQATDSMKVSGECGMCKKKIEKAAKDAGATYAVWNTDTKILNVKYNSEATTSAKIQQKIADAGYDTPKFKATDEAYNKLEQCCQYERESTSTEKKESAMNGKMNLEKTSPGKTAMKCSDDKSCCGKKTGQ